MVTYPSTQQPSGAASQIGSPVAKKPQIQQLHLQQQQQQQQMQLLQGRAIAAGQQQSINQAYLQQQQRQVLMTRTQALGNYLGVAGRPRPPLLSPSKQPPREDGGDARTG